jgi:hypothetical protein
MGLEHQHAGQAAHPVDVGKPEWSRTSHRSCHSQRHRGSIQNGVAKPRQITLAPSGTHRPDFLPQLIDAQCPATFPTNPRLYIQVGASDETEMPEGLRIRKR